MTLFLFPSAVAVPRVIRRVPAAVAATVTAPPSVRSRTVRARVAVTTPGKRKRHGR